MSANIYDTRFRELVKALHEDQKSFWNPENRIWAPSKKALQIKQVICGWEWKEVDEKLLQLALETDNIDFSIDQLILFLPPLEKETAHFVPAVSIAYKNGANCFSLRSIMITMIATEKPRRFPAIGFRIESPTINCMPSNGRHDFYHVQLNSKFGYGPHVETPDWIPETQPSFPIYANRPIDALLCLILTLYGGIYYKSFITRYASKKFIELASDEFKKFNKSIFQ